MIVVVRLNPYAVSNVFLVNVNLYKILVNVMMMQIQYTIFVVQVACHKVR